MDLAEVEARRLSTNMSEEAKTETPAAPPAKSGGSKLVPIMMVMNTLLVGGVLLFVMKKQAPVAVVAPAAAAPEGGEKSAEGAAGAKGGPVAGPGPMVKLENFVIQLKAVDSERYVRVAFDLEVGAETDKEVIQARLSHIRDSVISYFSDRTLDELRGSDGMDHIKQTLLKRLSGVVPGNRIKAIFITDFIVQ
jgi:flagellar protein FliL